MAQREARLSRRFIDYLKREGAFAWKVHGNGMQKRGMLDINFCLDGMYGSVETKLPGNNRPTELQAKCIRDIQAAGGYAIVATDLARVEALVAQMRSDRRRRRRLRPSDFR